MKREFEAGRQRDRIVDLRKLDMFRAMAARKFLANSAAILRLPIPEPSNDHTHSARRWKLVAGLITKNHVVEQLHLHPRYAMVPQLADRASIFPPRCDGRAMHGH